MKYIYENIDENSILKKYYTNNIEGTIISNISDKNHILYNKNQKGLFATKIWNKYDVIGEYTGFVLDSLNNSDYIICFPNSKMGVFICVDAEKTGNECRYINHYKNIKSIPNCKFVTSYIDKKPRILVVVTELINIGDEILADYCYNF